MEEYSWDPGQERIVAIQQGLFLYTPELGRMDTQIDVAWKNVSPALKF